MRPRPDAAENIVERLNWPPDGWASMRPRPDAAENKRRRRVRPGQWSACFNEAAARCRGKPAPFGTMVPDCCGFNEAAARCRGKPAAATRTPPRPPRRFNEAAARCRGKPGLIIFFLPRQPGFNEAAARCRGKLDQGGSRELVPVAASMRPRPDAAENSTPAAPGASSPTRFNEAAARCRGKQGEPRRRLACRRRASMRPRPDAAENIVRWFR